MGRKKLRVNVRRKKSSWITHTKKGKRVIAHKRKIKWISMRPDKGKKGKTPKYKQWSREVEFDEIPGYGIHKSQKRRLVALRRNIREEGGGHKGQLSTARTLQGIINLNPSRKSDRIMKRDLKRIYPSWGNK